ncbi:MAG: hypothetical protein ACXAC2_16380 [Candidatus Kariarchaeaceae archaeon]
MGELGSLSSETDSKLIASTLMALKDIVSVEASSGESQFMTGAVETSSFGTFAISLDEQSKLIMSYIISAEAGSTIDDSDMSIVQSLCNNIGKQLIQFGNISFLTTSGAQIPRSVLIKAFLNACVIVRMENNLPLKPRALERGYKGAIDSFFKQPKEIIEVYDYILDGDGWKRNTDYWEDGFLKSQFKEKLIVGLSNQIIYETANTDPSLFLFVDNPRNEPRHVYHQIKDELKVRVKNPYKKILEHLPKQMEGKVDKFMEKVPLVDLHTSEDNLYNEFVRGSLVKSLRKDPLVLFAEPDRESIQKSFTKLLPKVYRDNAGTILLKALKPALGDSEYRYVELFFTKFINEMSGISLSQTAMDLLVAFAQQFIGGKEISGQLDKLSDVPGRWVKSLSKFIGSREITQLKIDSIDEGIILTNAASSAVVNTLATAISDQFLFIDNSPGDVLEEMAEFYLTSGPSIKTSSVLVSILDALTELDLDVELITPLYIDFITAAAISKNIQLNVDNKLISIKRKKNSFVVQVAKKEHNYYQYLSDQGMVVFQKGDRVVEIESNRFDAINFLNLIDDPQLIVESVSLAAERRLHFEMMRTLDDDENFRPLDN